MKYWHYLAAGALALLSLLLLVIPFFNQNRGPLTWADVGTIAAVFAALAAMLVALGDRDKDKDYARSLFYLEKTIDGFEKAFSKIGDGNNLRTNWVAAARILERTKRIGEKITVQDHKDIFEIEMDYRRGPFHTLLKRPAPFFYGAKDESTSLADAAAQSTAPEGNTISTVKAIPEAAISTIFKVVSYPEDYGEVIKDGFSDDEIYKLPYDGLIDYLEHRRQFVSAAGKLHPLKK
ncbi:MAG: hypothetical protein AB7T27_03855 [Kiritimatiellia bacterium]